ncbi:MULTISPECIES: hypothetical protein [Halorussus]|uniref:hypothetical protein n=1 Tax=Halorussus TaxID=1070314 RepID=UPI000E20EBBE|nr:MULTISPECIES: hypothetical protein [Halorussus]NHN58800.1 hypothetical protein [Halorussus sp. JP-T4]
MSSPLEKPVVRYGMGLSSAAILTFVAFAFLEGTTRWLVLGMAVLEVAVVPQFLKWAAAQESA